LVLEPVRDLEERAFVSCLLDFCAEPVHELPVGCGRRRAAGNLAERPRVLVVVSAGRRDGVDGGRCRHLRGRANRGVGLDESELDPLRERGDARVT
jgi:hypothetical protein